MLCWHVLHQHDREHSIDIKGYHIPKASVRLISPQALYKSVGGHGKQDISKYSITLPAGITFKAPYGHGNLLILPMCLTNQAPCCFWSKCFSFHASDHNIWARSILAASNQNLILAQKELLLWHHRLSHAGLSTIQNISRQRCKVIPSSCDDLVHLHDGPLLPCTYNVPSTSCDNLLCAACEISKATRCSPTIHSTRIGAPRQMVLKENHANPGECVSCDHFISPVPRRVTSPSGHNSSRHGYTCGTIYLTIAAPFFSSITN